MTLVLLVICVGIAGVFAGAGILLGMDYRMANVAAMRRERASALGLVVAGMMLVAAGCWSVA